MSYAQCLKTFSALDVAAAAAAEFDYHIRRLIMPHQRQLYRLPNVYVGVAGKGIQRTVADALRQS